MLLFNISLCLMLVSNMCTDVRGFTVYDELVVKWYTLERGRYHSKLLYNRAW